MEKYEFRQKLKETVLIKKDNESTAMVLNGEEVEACCTGLCSRNISENGSPCLVSESENPEDGKYAVVAFSLDNPKRENKDWICIRPIIFEDAVEYFLANYYMEEMVNGCMASKRTGGSGKAEPDFVVGDAYIELNVPDAILNAADGGWIQVKTLLLTAETVSRHKDITAELQGTGKRIIFLITFQHGLNDRMQDFLCRELSESFGMHMDQKAEFWIVDLRLEADGVTLVSYQNVTERVMLE